MSSHESIHVGGYLEDQTHYPCKLDVIIPFFLKPHAIGCVGSSVVKTPTAPYRMMSSLRYLALRSVGNMAEIHPW